MSYEFDTAVVVDKATAKRLAKDCQDIFYGVTMIATDRYFFSFYMKWCERYEAILDEVRKSSYYEIMKVGEELDDIKFECCDNCEYYIDVQRELDFANNDCSIYTPIHDFLNEGNNGNNLTTEHMAIRSTMGGI